MRIIVCQYLFNVCDVGTGKTAVPAGYLIGGKTGTAEMYPRKTGNYVVSFVGFAPIDDPQVMIYVVTDRPNVADQPHSTFAQEIANDVLTEILPYMQIFRTEEISEEDEQKLKDLGIISGGNAEDVEDGSEGEDDESEADSVTDDQPTINYDSETGYPIDPNTGELLDPDTYMPIDNTASDLGGIGALVDDGIGLQLEE